MSELFLRLQQQASEQKWKVHKRMWDSHRGCVLVSATCCVCVSTEEWGWAITLPHTVQTVYAYQRAVRAPLSQPVYSDLFWENSTSLRGSGHKSLNLQLCGTMASVSHTQTCRQQLCVSVWWLVFVLVELNTCPQLLYSGKCSVPAGSRWSTRHTFFTVTSWSLHIWHLWHLVSGSAASAPSDNWNSVKTARNCCSTCSSLTLLSHSSQTLCDNLLMCCSYLGCVILAHCVMLSSLIQPAKHMQ